MRLKIVMADKNLNYSTAYYFDRDFYLEKVPFVLIVWLFLG